MVFLIIKLPTLALALPSQCGEALLDLYQFSPVFRYAYQTKTKSRNYTLLQSELEQNVGLSA